MEIVALSSESVRGDVSVEGTLRVPSDKNGIRSVHTTYGTWHSELRRAIRDPAELIAALELPSALVEPAQRAAASFPLFVPWPYIDRIAKGDAADPLLRQVLPLIEETGDEDGFVADPVGDSAAELSPGLLQKYHGRALLITTGACAVHCRYCFRRQYPYSSSPKSPTDWQPALERIAADPSVEEVILSGGDPLTLVDGHLADLAERIATIEHVQRLRIHTRLPIMIPQRVTIELIDWLRGTRLTPIMVVHANHPQEIDEPTAAALSRLIDAGIPVLNQSVLLRGVNDNAEALIGLSRRLIDLRVMPYYLHQLDRVAGAAHFEVPISRGRELIAAMRRALPGYALPRYVQELAGEGHKHILA
ncbi:MAG: EF-P beta-lysylation protein EpmB [Planctomycetia bacterium]|nr:EF-P beta-lysylation protein EpmB [Planctomycetia bacterium]